MRPEWWQGGQWGPWAAFVLGRRRGRFFEFGEVRLAVLSLLGEGPKHGYQLMKEMTERSGGLYRASAGSVYPTLQQLEDDGLIEFDRQEGRKIYRLTESGRQELQRESEPVNRIWERAERWEDWGQFMGPQTIALAGPLAAIVKATLRATARAEGKPERERGVHEILERACRELEDLDRPGGAQP